MKKYFDIPATVGTQGGIRQFSVTLPMRVLEHIIAIDDSGNTMERSQRPVNHARTSRIFDYVSDNVHDKKPYILPTLSGNLEGEVAFTPFEGHTSVGMLRIYRGADIKFFDGQHRATSIKRVASVLKSFNDTITLLLTDNIDLLTRQQFFSDINYNAVKPSAAQNKAYDKRDARNTLAAYVATTCYPFQSCLDYEKNVVTGSNPNIFSFKTLYDCLVKMFKLNEKSEITEQMKSDGVLLMSAWSTKMHWSIIGGWMSSNAPAYRQKYLGTHAVMVVAIGVATRYLLDTRSVEEAVAVIKDAEFHYEKQFGFEDWERRCVEVDTWKIKCDARAIKLSASLLLQLLNVVFPEDLKQLEADTFGIDPATLRTSEEPEAYAFDEDKRLEPPLDTDGWLTLLNEHLAPQLKKEFINDIGIRSVASTLSTLESEIILKCTRADLIDDLKTIADMSSSELKFLWDRKATKVWMRRLTPNDVASDSAETDSND